MDIESNLLFAVLAMQADLIDDFQFWEAVQEINSPRGNTPG